VPQPEPVNAPTSTRPHIAARLEDRFFDALGDRLCRRKGWAPHVEAYTGYGCGDWVRVLARAVLAPRDPHPTPAHDRRGWRSYLSVPAPGEVLRVSVGGAHAVLVADRAGYIDARLELPAPLDAGWHAASVTTEDGRVASCPLLVVGADETFGVVSDIDDTVVDTRLPRPLIAFWNTFVLHPRARREVPGMADLYAGLHARYPDAPFVYLSTGAWNTAGTLRRFLDVHGFPQGPLLLTDWGPTNTGWFRSGAAHKHGQLERLFDELPGIRWLLVGDDGQHDPVIYERVARERPDHVAAVAIRQLTPAQQVLSHGLPVPLPPPRGTDAWWHGTVHGPHGTDASGRPAGEGAETPSSTDRVPVVRGQDGTALRRALLGTVK